MREMDSDAAFEQRMRRRYEAALKRLLGRRWRCTECGELYTAGWVAWNGPWCHDGCGHPLVELKSGGENANSSK